jgi:hypothetical protein
MMKQIGKRVTLVSEGEQRATLSPETKSLLNGLEAEVVISGKFFVPAPPQIRIMVSIYRYVDGNRQILQHIADCQVDCPDYMKDLLKAIDTLTVKITNSLKQNGTKYALSGAERIASAQQPDIAGIMIAQLNQANQMASYLTQTEEKEKQADKKNNRGQALSRKKSPSAAPAKIPSINKQDELLKEGNTQEKSLSAEDYRNREKEEMDEFVGELAKKEPAKDLKSKEDKNADENKKTQGQNKKGFLGVGEPPRNNRDSATAPQANQSPGGLADNQEVLINKLKQMYENIQKIEDKK